MERRTEIKNIKAVFFSPTGGTKKVVLDLAAYIALKLATPYEQIDLTHKEARERKYEFKKDDLVIIGSPVYAGRLPNKIMPDLQACLSGDHGPVIAVCTYGNRSFGGAVDELRIILQKRGFAVLGAAAVVSRHAFTDHLAGTRPDQEDMREIHAFADRMTQKLQADKYAVIHLEEDMELLPYYTPLKENGEPAIFLKAKPLTDPNKCDGCGLCVRECPVQSIEEKDPSVVSGICIKCQACVRRCPQKAKYFEDAHFLSHVRMIENHYSERKELRFFE